MKNIKFYESITQRLEELTGFKVIPKYYRYDEAVDISNGILKTSITLKHVCQKLDTLEKFLRSIENDDTYIGICGITPSNEFIYKIKVQLKNNIGFIEISSATYYKFIKERHFMN